MLREREDGLDAMSFFGREKPKFALFGSIEFG